MTPIRLVSVIGTFALGGAILFALVTADFGEEGSVLLDMAWGWVSVLDVYTGAALVAMWIWWRDGVAAGVLWLVLLFVLGHLATALYVGWRAFTSESVPALLVGHDRLSKI